MKNYPLLAAGVLFIAGAAHAESGAIDCTNMVAKAGYKAFRASDQAGFTEVIAVTRTRTGKDRYFLEYSVNEECLTGVILYTKAGTCQVISKPVEVGQRDCG